MTYKPIPFYFINTTDPEELSRAAADTAMRRLQEAGYGGAMLFNKPPDGFSRELYLAEPWFEAVGHFLEAAEAAGMEIWLNDGWNFPPGEAGGRIEKAAPHLGQRRLRRNDDGTLEVVPVPWGFPAFEEPEASRLFIQTTYAEYERRFARHFGKTLRGFFSDADNRRSSHFTRKELNGQKYYPWPTNFESLFRDRYGYDILPKMQAVINETDARACEDYWALVSELYQTWFQRNSEWCHAHGLEYSFHTSDTGPLTYERCDRTSVFTEGETLRLLSFSDRPGTDHELAALDGGTHYDRRYAHFRTTYGGPLAVHPAFNVTKWDLRAKYAASAAHLNGRPRVLCESFAATNWSSTAALMRRIAAWQLMQGVNFFVPHAVHHRRRGQVKDFAPPEQTMVPGVRELNDFLAHFSFVASQGEYVEPMRLADPTRALWRSDKDESLFERCDRLNRMAVNYVIVPEGTPADDGIPAPYATFDGGELAWMLRRLPDGTRYLLAANIWAEQELRGIIRFDGKTYPVALAAGEIAVLGGPWEAYRRPDDILSSRPLAAERIPVSWEKPNLIPLFHTAVFTAAEELPPLTLLLPQGATARLDGRALAHASETLLFDDPYGVCAIEATPGEHVLALESVPSYCHAFLCGEFDLRTERPLVNNYELAVDGPCLELSRRRGMLSCGSWTAQGHPFYSGRATYRFEVDAEGENALDLGDVGCVAELLIDGQAAGRRVWAPYRLTFPPLHGRHLLEVRVENTLSNQLEAQAAPAGLLAIPQLQTLTSPIK